MNFFEVNGHYSGDEEPVTGIVCTESFNKFRKPKMIDDDIMYWEVSEQDIIESINTRNPLPDTDFIVTTYYPTEI